MQNAGRPKTAAAEFERLTVRLPVGLMAEVRAQAEEGRRPLNSQILLMLEDCLRKGGKPALASVG